MAGRRGGHQGAQRPVSAGCQPPARQDDHRHGGADDAAHQPGGLHVRRRRRGQQRGRADGRRVLHHQTLLPGEAVQQEDTAQHLVHGQVQEIDALQR